VVARRQAHRQVREHRAPVVVVWHERVRRVAVARAHRLAHRPVRQAHARRLARLELHQPDHHRPLLRAVAREPEHPRVRRGAQLGPEQVRREHVIGRPQEQPRPARLPARGEQRRRGLLLADATQVVLQRRDHALGPEHADAQRHRAAGPRRVQRPVALRDDERALPGRQRVLHVGPREQPRADAGRGAQLEPRRVAPGRAHALDAQPAARRLRDRAKAQLLLEQVVRAVAQHERLRLRLTAPPRVDHARIALGGLPRVAQVLPQLEEVDRTAGERAGGLAARLVVEGVAAVAAQRDRVVQPDERLGRVAAGPRHAEAGVLRGDRRGGAHEREDEREDPSFRHDRAYLRADSRRGNAIRGISVAIC